MITRKIFVIGLLCGQIASAVALAQHAGDVFVGRSAAGQLKRGGFDMVENYVSLMPVSGLINGWTDNDPGFDRIIMNDPGGDLFALQAGAQIWLQAVDIDPAFRVIDSAFGIIDDPGEQTFLGGNNLHVHVTWHINSNAPDFDAEQCIWEATFILYDIGSTTYQPSEPFTLRFTNVALLEADGDWDQDIDVDEDDFAAWPDCFAGPDVRPAPDDVTNCEIDCLNEFDFDDDNDIDLVDFAVFQSIFLGV